MAAVSRTRVVTGPATARSRGGRRLCAWPVLMLAALLALTAGPATAQDEAGVDAEDLISHFLAIGVCPPWKEGSSPAITAAMRTACGNAIDALVPAMRDRLGVDPANVTRLLDDQASYAAVASTLTDLAGTLDQNDRLYVYINLHGGVLPGIYRGYQVEDEALALWTEEEPDFSTAIESRAFMFVRELRDLVMAIPTGQTVIILDACESGAGFRDFRYEPGSLADRLEHTAIIFSAQFDQAANFTPDDAMALFTREFVESLEVTAGQSLANAVGVAARATHGEVRLNCRNFGPEVFNDQATYLDICTQLPLVFDPYGVLDTITVGVPPVPEALRGPDSADGGSAG